MEAKGASKAWTSQTTDQQRSSPRRALQRSLLSQWPSRPCSPAPVLVRLHSREIGVGDLDGDRNLADSPRPQKVMAQCGDLPVSATLSGRSTGHKRSEIRDAPAPVSAHGLPCTLLRPPARGSCLRADTLDG